MDSCSHRPSFKFKMLFSRSTKYTCKKCGADIEMTSNTKMVSKLINGLTIGGLVYMALNGGKNTKADPSQMIIYFAEMGGIVFAYLLLQILLILFGKFQEVAAPEVTPDDSGTTDAAAGTESSEPKPEFSPEQLELMALYESYAKLDRAEGEEAPSMEAAPVPEEDTCDHIPAKNWKNYVPGIYDFKCDTCGKVITFSMARKKRLNLILLLISSAVLMASFTKTDMPFWAIILMVPSILLVGAVVQYFFVKNSIFELKTPLGK